MARIEAISHSAESRMPLILQNQSVALTKLRFNNIVAQISRLIPFTARDIIDSLRQYNLLMTSDAIVFSRVSDRESIILINIDKEVKNFKNTELARSDLRYSQVLDRTCHPISIFSFLV